MWHGQAVIPKTTTLALSPGPGNETEIDDGPLVGNCGSAHSNSTLATASRSHRTWPAEIDLVCVDSGKLKLSVQSQLLKLIIKEAFENLRQELLFDGAFPTPKDIPRVVRKCLVNAARDHSTRGGHNASAACVHHRLLTDIDYEIKMGQLVSAITSTTSLLMVISAASPHFQLSRSNKRVLCSDDSTFFRLHKR